MQSISDDKNIQLLASFALSRNLYVITSRQRNWVKVMFSRVSVSHSVHSCEDISGPMSFQGVDISGTRFLLEGGVCSGGYVQEVYPGVDMRPGIPWDMVGKWAIRILPECFPIRNGLRVYKCYYSHLTTKND